MLRALHLSFLIAVLLPLNLLGQRGFQQRVDHRIHVRLDDEEKMLHGKQEIRYINRSNSKLNCIFFHLWPEAYSSPETALCKQLRKQGDLSLYYASERERGYMDSLDFRVDGKKVPFYRDPEHPDIGHIFLDEPLASGDTVQIRTSFRVKIPHGQFSRMGFKGDAFKITQWYPKPAVYDEDGWHPMPYLQQGEFYNEFGSYDVRITLPKNYTVGATGKLTGESGERERLDRIFQKTKELDSFPQDFEHPPSSEEMKTLRYRADSVTDFAWFADKRYRVMQERVQLPRSDRTVLARVFFTDHEADRWEHAIDYLEDALYYYSLWVGPYPHDRISVVSSRSGVGGGMEYPGISVIGPTNSGLMLERVIAHEVGHNWFQGVLATNERKDPWMDEGLNSYYENRYMRVQHPDILPFQGLLPRGALEVFGMVGRDPMYQHYLQYRTIAGQEADQALSSHSTTFTSKNYAVMAYSKGALLFDHLEQYLGQETVDRAIRAYYSEWRFRHPEEEDLERAFTQRTEKDLSPFFEGFLHSTGKIDMRLKKVEKGGEFRYGDRYRVTVENEGDIAAPVPLTVIQEDTMVEEKWIEGLEDERKIELPYHTGQVKAFGIDGKERVPEIDRRNDRYNNRSLFPRQGGLEIDPFFGIDDPNKNGLYLFPSLGWNRNDGFMAGLGIHERGLMAEPFSFALAPMYGFKSKEITGLGAIGWNGWWDESPILDHMRIGLQLKRFSDRSFIDHRFTYTRITPRLELWYEKGEARSPHRHRTVLETPFIATYLSDRAFLEGLERSRSYISFQQFWEKESSLLPMEAELRGVHHERFTRLSARWQGAFRYNDDKKALSLRLFGGKFLKSEHALPAYNFRMDGRGPNSDFLYEHYFFGRGSRKGIWSQEMAREEGGFYIPTAHGSSNDWIASAGLELDLPFPENPNLSLYFNQGWAADPFSKNPLALYEAGASVELIEDMLSVHVPVLFSERIEEEHKINKIGLWQRIRFQIRLDRLQLFQRLRTHTL